ncbi:hypothetical protein BD289DRAFT_158176 [Coniella lustricola]|uniref:Zn(2)-C6 fungal-type domain-containing protein n=1 Tax=Coniella lustricola TaxID=2025994 RepID=A0A2T3AMP4_9PEZI|nr:hypothetical protein BD289DRAFT_158176 [Coniella lustricola]
MTTPFDFDDYINLTWPPSGWGDVLQGGQSAEPDAAHDHNDEADYNDEADHNDSRNDSRNNANELVSDFSNMSRTYDSYDEANSLMSDDRYGFAPALSFGGPTDSSVPPTNPSVASPLDNLGWPTLDFRLSLDLDLGADFPATQLDNTATGGLSDSNIDFLKIGNGPQIFESPVLPQELDLRDLGPPLQSHPAQTQTRSLPALAVQLPLPTYNAGAPALGPPSQTGSDPLSVTAMARERSRRNGPLSEDQRLTTAHVRKRGSCHRCHILCIKCDLGSPCAHCQAAFPDCPEVCDREKLTQVLSASEDLPEGIWLALDAASSSSSHVLFPESVPITIAFDPPGSPHHDSPGLDLQLQQCGINMNAFQSPVPNSAVHYPPHSTPTFAAVPPSTTNKYFGASTALPYFGPPSWDGMGLNYSGSLASYKLDPRCLPLQCHLFRWANMQVACEFKRREDFETAIGALVFSLQKLPRPAPPPPTNARQRKRSNAQPMFSPQSLVNNVCQVMCWFRIWQAEHLYVKNNMSFGLAPNYPTGNEQGHGQDDLLVGVLSELKRQAIGYLADAHRHVLKDLDTINTVKGSELEVLVCLWQMMLIYRQVIAIYSAVARSRNHAGPRNVAMALKIFGHLNLILCIKYGAYFRHTSPHFPPRGQPSTAEVLRTQPHLKAAWEDVVKQRRNFRTFLLDILFFFGSCNDPLFDPSIVFGLLQPSLLRSCLSCGCLPFGVVLACPFLLLVVLALFVSGYEFDD